MNLFEFMTIWQFPVPVQSRSRSWWLSGGSAVVSSTSFVPAGAVQLHSSTNGRHRSLSSSSLLITIESTSKGHDWLHCADRPTILTLNLAPPPPAARLANASATRMQSRETSRRPTDWTIAFAQGVRQARETAVREPARANARHRQKKSPPSAGFSSGYDRADQAGARSCLTCSKPLWTWRSWNAVMKLLIPRNRAKKAIQTSSRVAFLPNSPAAQNASPMQMKPEIIRTHHSPV